MRCEYCGKPIEGETLQDGERCPHCGKSLASLLDSSSRIAGLAISPTRRSWRVRLRRITDNLRTIGLVISAIAIALVILIKFGSGLGLLLILILIMGFFLTLLGNIVKRIRQSPPGEKVSWLLVRESIALTVLFILILGVISPLFFRYSDPSPETDALSDCRNISTAMRLFHKDTGTWPIYASPDRIPESRVDFLYGNIGDMPTFKDDEVRESWGTRSEDIYVVLVTNGRETPWYRYAQKSEGESHRPGTLPRGWAGPYLPYVTDDPWGYAYLISVSGFEGGTKPDNHVWCLSAGADCIVDTPAWATETRGDDVGYRVSRWRMN